MKVRILQVAFLLLTTSAAKADFVGIHGGAGYWESQIGGDILIDQVNLEDDLNLTGNGSPHFWFALEHPVPLLPNIRVAATQIEDSGNGAISQDFVFLGTSYTVSEEVYTEVELTHADVTLYYEIIDIGMDLDVGVTARWIDAKVRIDDFTDAADVVVPMIYARAKVGLPFSGGYFAGNVNAANYRGNGLTDFTVKVGWETENFIFPEFGIEVGYRDFSLNADDSDLYFDVNAEGAFLNLTAHF
jgi:outer membrane protein